MSAGIAKDRSHCVRRPVTIVIVTWNGLDFTRACLDSIARVTDFEDYEVVVVDNGSSDGTVPYLQSLDWVTVLPQGRNLGFAKANNVALTQVVPGRDVILLNNDTLIVQADWIKALQDVAFSASDVGPVGCRLVRPDGTLQHAGAFMPPHTYWGKQIGSGQKDINQLSDNREVESVVFACVYLRQELLEHVGYLEEEYISYFEDSDYCLRAAAAGFKTLCCGSVTIVHHENISTKVNGVPHSAFFDRARNVFRRRWAKQLEATRYTRRIGWHSLLNFATGYAISSGQLVKALDSKAVEVSYQYVYGPGTVSPRDEPKLTDDYLLNSIKERPLDRSLPQVVYAQGDVFERNSGSYRVGFTMLETDRIPEEWVRQANLMDEVWCPSEFNRKTFNDSGVTRPIYVVPLGVDPDYFNPKLKSRRVTDNFTFLSIFEWGERKAPEVLLHSFNREFRATEPVILICKVTNVDAGVNVHDEIRKLELDPRGGRIVFSLNDLIPTYQLGVLYRSADCFVLPTRGEGWGMPIIEAMACGLPVIATDWSAHCDFMTDTNSYPLEVRDLIPAVAKCPYYSGFRWADPSRSHLRHLMRHVFSNPAEALAKGDAASNDVRAGWTWAKAADRILDRIRAIEFRSEVDNVASARRQSPGGVH